jgi:tetratricopeptide (TPR) repeat protein
VLLGTDGRARVCDFGLARADADRSPATVDASSPQADSDLGTGLTRDGMVVGTAHYMAPEQHYGERVTAATDQYAFCVSLWEALYGAHPFKGKRGAELVAAKRSPPRPPEGVDLPHELSLVLARGLQHEAGDRFASMHELVAALRRSQGSRPRWWLPVAGAVLVVLPFAAWRQDAPCDPERRVESVWNPAVAAEIEAAFAATDAGWARETWTRTEAALDVHFDAWADTYRDACRAGADIDHVMACLETRLRESDAVLRVLAEPDDDTVRNAVQAVRRLEPAAACASPELWLSSRPLPAARAQHPAVERVRERLVRARTLETAGRYAEALAVANAALTEAAAIGFAAVEAEALVRVASAHGRVRDVDAEQDALERAYFLAAHAQHDIVAANAAIHLAFVSAEHRSDLRAAERWAGLAQSNLTRIGGDARLEADLELALGVIASGAGRNDDALAHYARARDLAGDGDPLALATMTNSGVVHIQRNDNAGARRAFAEAVAWATRELGPDHPGTADAHDKLAVVLRDGGAIEDAIAEHRTAVEILERGVGPEHPLLTRPLLNFARSTHDTGDAAMALSQYQRALALADGMDAGVVLNNMGQLLTEQGYYDAARVHLRRALELYEAEFGAGHPRTAYPLLALGELDEVLGLYAEALVQFEHAREVTLSGAGPLHATALHRIAEVKAAQGELDEALRLHREELEVASAVEGGTPLVTVAARMGVGKTLVRLGRPDEARPELEQALATLGDRRGRPRVRAYAKFVLGEALWSTPDERAHALRLVQEAAEILRADALAKRELAEVETWLREHDPNLR